MNCIKKCILAIVFATCLHAYGLKQNNDIQTIKNTIMSDIENRLDFDLLDKFAERTVRTDFIGEFVNYRWSFTDESGTEIRLFGDTRSHFTMWEPPPKPAFHQIFREFHSSGYLKEIGKLMGSVTEIGIWKYFDEAGNLIKTVDEDKKFGKFGYNELLLFLHQQGYINLETGENRKGARFGYNVETGQWDVSVRVGAWLTRYVIDGETGEVLSKEGPSPIIR